MARVKLSCDEYLAEVLSLVAPIAEVAGVELAEALGRTLAAPVLARGDVPAFANSQMDGYAVRARDLAPGVELLVTGEVLAGSGADPAIGSGECVRIMTGAPLPTDADAVVPIEQVTVTGDGVRIDEPVTEGNFVRPRGHDVHAGDEMLPAGTRLSAHALATAAAAGVAEVTCVRPPAVGVLATGDELVAPGGEPGRGQIFDSNSTFLRSALLRDGAVPMPRRVADEEPAFRAALDELSAQCDVIVVSGGVSVGDADVTRIVLEQAGAEFRHVSIQPGKPQGWARWNGVPVVGLPGNPVSVAVSYELFVAPMLDRMLGRSGAEWTAAVAAEGWNSPAGRQQFLPVVLEVGDDGRQLVRPAHRMGSASHMVTSLAHADALASVPADVTRVAPGDLVRTRRLQ